MLACFLVSVSTLAQIGSSPAAEGSNAQYTLYGTVVNSVTGAPIRRALVQIYMGNQRLAFTDSNGQFEFDNLPPGETRVNVRKPGFFSEEELNGEPSVPPMIAIGSDTQSLSLKLVPQGVITGHIQSVNGEPLEGIPVRAITARIDEGRKHWVELGGSSTNEDGEFRLANLHPGSYYLQIGPSNGFGELRADADGYPAVFYPGVPDMSSATPFAIAAGQQVTANLSLRPVQLFKVSGRLAGYTGGGINIMFVDHLGNNFSFLRRVNPTTGAFEGEVPAGSYTLQATEWTRDAKPRRAEIPLNVSSDMSGVVLALGTMLPIPITVTTENMKHEAIEAHPPFQSSLVNVHLIRIGDQLGNTETWSSFQGAPNPSLVIPNAEPGTYSVEFMPNSPWYVQSAQCGATDLLREPLTISAGAQTPPIEVVLRNDGATVTGQVGNGQTNQFATVLLVPDEGSGMQIKSGDTIGPNLQFRFADVAPGGYSVLAVDHARALEYRNRDVLGQYLSRAAHVTLDPNGKETVPVDLVNVGN
ncbi:MAG TPA: carboxypeptidase-like regulatory domain-containing protein [Terriglobales bacterium]|nr:carboxypeptidase-like regulatory domain-containing protein [Terriglobales bacterium]